MAPSPVAVLVIIGIWIAFYSVYTGSQQDTRGLDKAQDFKEPTGIIDSIVGVIHTVWTFITLVLGALVFAVPGVPFEVRIPIAVAINGSLTWSVVTLIRGN